MSCDHGHRPLHYPTKTKTKQKNIKSRKKDKKKKNVQVQTYHNIKAHYLVTKGGGSMVMKKYTGVCSDTVEVRRI